MPRPPLPRPSRRLILMACLLLLVGGGAVVNVAVAWGIAALGRRQPIGPWAPMAAVHEAAPWHIRLEPPGDDVWTCQWTRGYWYCEELDLSGPLRGSFTTAFGWPRVSLRLPDSLRRQRALSAPAILVDAGLFERSEGLVPIDPFVPGFAINTLFYTAILALPLSFFPIRRRLRARRGRCPKCGYDLAGLGGADPAAPCPECGATR